LVIKLQAGQFYGATSGMVAQAGFCFTEKSYQPQSSLPRHAHELAHFCFILGGSYTETLLGRNVERMSAELIFYPAGITHAEMHHTGGRCFLIELERKHADTMRDYGVLMNEPASFAAKSPNWLAVKLYREFRNIDELSMLALEGMALELLVDTSRNCAKQPERRSPKWLDEAKEILRSSFSGPPGLYQLAKSVGVHPVHLVRVFRKFQHCTIGEYIRQLRVEDSRHRMVFTDDSLVEIALSSGFADHTHFSRSFKRVTGMTPSEFRKLMRRR
jgi:AraC family transcriptional regulator